MPAMRATGSRRKLFMAARIGVARGGLESAGGVVPGGLIVAEAETGGGPTTGVGLIVLKLLDWETEQDGMLAVHPTHVIVQSVVVFGFIERCASQPFGALAPAKDMVGNRSCP